MDSKWEKDYKYDELEDFDSDWVYGIMSSIVLNGEQIGFTGTVRITFEYIPSQEELEEKSTKATDEIRDCIPEDRSE